MATMKVGAKKPAATQSLESLFTSMYNQADLRADVIGFIQPFIMSAHNLLGTQKDVKKESKNALASDESFIHLDMEEKRKLENILYRDLPNLIADYTELPIDYRNQKKLNSGKTHRETLIENIELIANQIEHLEETAFSAMDTKARVKSQVLKQRYGLEFEAQPQEHKTLTSNFDFAFYQQHGKKIQQATSKIAGDLKNQNDAIQYQAAIYDGEITYKVKKNFKSFMSGTYSLATKMMDALSPQLLSARLSVTGHKMRRKHGMTIMFTALAISGVTGAALLHKYDINPLTEIKAEYNNVGLSGKNISDNIRALSVHEVWNYDKTRAMNVQMYQKMMSPESHYYMKGWSFTNEDGSKLNITPKASTDKYAHEYIDATLSKVSRFQCQDAYDAWSWNDTENPNFVINNHTVKKTHDMDEQAQAKQLCDLPSNQISFKLRIH
jgi:hypothetical protein